MTDQQNRTIDYLRISVTDRCNLRCTYCMPAQGITPVSHEEILSFEELVRICQSAASLGICKIKLTGGEPLVRRGIVDLVRQIKQIQGIEQVTMTTNGILLGGMAELLQQAGLDGVNISLDTLDPDRFVQITRRTGLEQVLDSIHTCLKLGMKTKLNCVLSQENYLQEAPALAILAKDNPLDVRFIELMPIGDGAMQTGVSDVQIKALLSERFGSLIPCTSARGNGPASYVSVEGFAGKLGFISAVSDRFCASCNRVRLTATGFLKLCLHYDYGIDLKVLLRSGATDAQLSSAIFDAIAGKPLAHQFGVGQIPHGEQQKMVQIGG